MGNIKMTFSKYCTSGFNGKDCVCKRCCEEQDKPFDETEEHKNWIYSQVMRGESFIIDSVRPMVTFDENKRPQFGKSFKCFFKAEIGEENIL